MRHSDRVQTDASVAGGMCIVPVLAVHGDQRVALVRTHAWAAHPDEPAAPPYPGASMLLMMHALRHHGIRVAAIECNGPPAIAQHGHEFTNVLARALHAEGVPVKVPELPSLWSSSSEQGSVQDSMASRLRALLKL